MVVSNDGRVELSQWHIEEGAINPIINQVTPNVWYHVAISWDGTKNHAYVNGNFVESSIPSEPPATSVDAA